MHRLSPHLGDIYITFRHICLLFYNISMSLPKLPETWNVQHWSEHERTKFAWKRDHDRFPDGSPSHNFKRVVRWTELRAKQLFENWQYLIFIWQSCLEKSTRSCENLFNRCKHWNNNSIIYQDILWNAVRAKRWAASNFLNVNGNNWVWPGGPEIWP